MMLATYSVLSQAACVCFISSCKLRVLAQLQSKPVMIVHYQQGRVHMVGNILVTDLKFVSLNQMVCRYKYQLRCCLCCMLPSLLPVVNASDSIGRQSCANPADLSKGLAPFGPVTKLFLPRECINPSTRLIWVGRRCGRFLEKVEYTSVYALYTPTGRVAYVKGRPCAQSRSSFNSTLATAMQLFGKCGTAPTLARTLPSTLCSQTLEVSFCAPVTPKDGQDQATASTSATSSLNTTASTKVTLVSFKTELSVPMLCGGMYYTSVTYYGRTCTFKFLHWNFVATEDGCVLRPSLRLGDVRTNANIFGSCGVPPTLPKYLPMVACQTREPPPPPLPFVLSRSAVREGEAVPENLKQIEAVARDAVADAALLQGSLDREGQVVVGVLDTGVELWPP